MQLDVFYIYLHNIHIYLRYARARAHSAVCVFVNCVYIFFIANGNNYIKEILEMRRASGASLMLAFFFVPLPSLSFSLAPQGSSLIIFPPFPGESPALPSILFALPYRTARCAFFILDIIIYCISFFPLLFSSSPLLLSLALSLSINARCQITLLGKKLASLSRLSRS